MSRRSDEHESASEAGIATVLLAVLMLLAPFLTGSFPMTVLAMLGVPFPFVVALGACAFWLWIRPTRLGAPLGPWRTMVSLVALALASAYWFSAGWSHRLRYQGPVYTYSRAILSVGALVLCAFFCFRSLRGRSPSRSLWAHWLMWAWALGFAFPWLGEM